jgi:lipopolysaccharide transport protein LptA
VGNDVYFDNATNEAVLTGKARLQQSGSVVEGQVIRFDVKTGAVSVEGGVSGVFSAPAPGVAP